METILQVQNIEKYYGNKGNLTKAVDDISFQVDAGEYIGIMGASGSGKTTLLNCISTIDTVTAGHIYIGGQDITTLNAKRLSKFRREQLGFIFQDFNLLDTLTAFENIALALTILNTPPQELERRITAVAKKLPSPRFCKNTLTRCPAVKNSVSPALVPSSPIRHWCSRMSQPARSTPKPHANCSKALKRSTMSWAPPS